MTIGLIIAAVVLFGGRIALELLAEKYQFLGQWLTIVTIALVVVTAVLIIAVLRNILEQFAAMRNLIPKKSEAQQGQVQAAQRKREKERGEMRAERRAQKSARAAWRQAEKAKIQRVESYEKQWRRERGGR